MNDLTPATSERIQNMSKDNPYWAVIEMNRDGFNRALGKLRGASETDRPVLLKSAEKLCIYSQAIEFYLGADLDDYEPEYLDGFQQGFAVAADMIRDRVLAVLDDQGERKEVLMYIEYIEKRSLALSRQPV
jgi:hypothetical protein